MKTVTFKKRIYCLWCNCYISVSRFDADESCSGCLVETVFSFTRDIQDTSFPSWGFSVFFSARFTSIASRSGNTSVPPLNDFILIQIPRLGPGQESETPRKQQQPVVRFPPLHIADIKGTIVYTIRRLSCASLRGFRWNKQSVQDVPETAPGSKPGPAPSKCSWKLSVGPVAERCSARFCYRRRM